MEDSMSGKIDANLVVMTVLFAVMVYLSVRFEKVLLKIVNKLKKIKTQIEVITPDKPIINPPIVPGEVKILQVVSDMPTSTDETVRSLKFTEEGPKEQTDVPKEIDEKKEEFSVDEKNTTASRLEFDENDDYEEITDDEEEIETLKKSSRKHKKKEIDSEEEEEEEKPKKKSSKSSKSKKKRVRELDSDDEESSSSSKKKQKSKKNSKKRSYDSDESDD